VALKVLDLDAQIDFYQRFGLALISRDGDVATLGAGDTSLQRVVQRSTDAYHEKRPDEKDVGKDVSARSRWGPKRLLGWNTNTNLGSPRAAYPARAGAS